MPSPSQPLLRLWISAVVLAICLSGCKGGSRVESGNRDGILYVANESEPADLDPNTNIAGDSEKILSTLFEGLVTHSGDGVGIMPGVAQSWDISPDGLTYTFHLRADAKWSNGAPVTSEDFQFSFRRVFDPLVACEESSFGYAIKGSEAFALGREKDPSTLGIDAPDPHTFVLRLAHPAPYLLGVLAGGSPFMPVYRPLVEKFGGAHQRGTPWTREGNLIGNGPFRLVKWVQNQVVQVRKNPLYWNAGHITLNGVDFVPVEDASTQERGFRTGQFHITTLFPISKGPAYEGSEALHRSRLQRSQFLTFNIGLAPYSDPRVRKAISMALDRRSMVEAVYHSFADPAFSQLRPGTGGFTPPFSPTFNNNPAEARRLLAEAGFPGGKGFPVVELMLVGKTPEILAMGEVIQAQLKDGLGITVQATPTEEKVYLDAERSKHYQVMLDTWGYPWNDPSAYYQTAQTGNPNNDSGWSDPAFDRAFRDAEEATDPRSRERAFAAQEARLAEGVPYVPLFFPNTPTLIAKSVRGWVDGPKRYFSWSALSVAR